MQTLSQLVLNSTQEFENKNDINETLLVELVKRLIESEYEPGGPYLSEGKIDPLLNALIFKLFLLLNKPLPKVEKYLDDIQLSTLDISDALQKTFNEISHIKTVRKLKDKPNNLKNGNYNFLENFISNQSPEIGTYIRETGNKIIKADKDGEITDILASFQMSYKSPSEYDANTLRQLGIANFMVWVAYTIYDDVIDMDSKPDFVSIANIALRESLKIYITVFDSLDLVYRYMDQVDNANFWETSNCRFKQNKLNVEIISIPSENDMENMLANRAIAHVIGMIHIAQKDKLDVVTIDKALRYYCIARQLNDDLHDWSEDFNNGIMNFVVVKLLQAKGITNGVYDKSFLLGELKSAFYDHELVKMCKKIETYISKSKDILIKSGFYEENNIFFDKVLTPIAISAIKAQKNHIKNKVSVLKFNS